MSFLKTSEIARISGDFANVFQMFSSGRFVTVHKAPLKTAVGGYDSSNGIFCFGDSQQMPEYSYIPVNKTFPAVVRYKANVNQNANSQLGAFYSKGGISIQVQPDCASYILNNETIKIEVDDRAWKTIGPPETRKFLENEYYVFYLENIQ